MKNTAAVTWKNRIVGEAVVNPADLTANRNNWRNHSAQQREAIDGVLGEVGWVQRVIVNKRTNQIVDGHARVEQAAKAGQQVPVVYVDLSEREEQVILATLDPIAAMAESNKAGLTELLAGLDGVQDWLKDVEMGGRLFGDLIVGAGATDEVADTLPSKVPSRSKPGDVWVLGQHRILHGDSCEKANVNKLLAGEEPFLMVTDPPYGVELDMEWRDRAGLNGTPGTKRSRKDKKVNKMTPKHPSEPSYMRTERTEGHTETSISGDTIVDWSPAFALVPSLSVAYVWHASAHTVEVVQGLLKLGFLYPQQIIWNKGRPVLTRTHYWFQHEPCWYVRKKNAPWLGAQGGDNKSVWEARSPKFIMGGSKAAGDEKQDHPTQKPVELMRIPIVNHTRRGDLVYEPFLGSGTTLIAAEMTERACRGIELDGKFVDLVIARWETFTGKKAKKV